jgi:hypothetical protein
LQGRKKSSASRQDASYDANVSALSVAQHGCARIDDKSVESDWLRICRSQVWTKRVR